MSKIDLVIPDVSTKKPTGSCTYHYDPNLRLLNEEMDRKWVTSETERSRLFQRGSRPARPHYDYSQSLASSRKRDVPRTYYTYRDGLKGEP